MIVDGRSDHLENFSVIRSKIIKKCKMLLTFVWECGNIINALEKRRRKAGSGAV